MAEIFFFSMNLRSLMGNFEGGDSLIACTFFPTGCASRLVCALRIVLYVTIGDSVYNYWQLNHFPHALKKVNSI